MARYPFRDIEILDARDTFDGREAGDLRDTTAGGTEQVTWFC
jgi:hypothetical protein